jgi:hypothetical protein
MKGGDVDGGMSEPSSDTGDEVVKVDFVLEARALHTIKQLWPTVIDDSSSSSLSTSATAGVTVENATFMDRITTQALYANEYLDVMLSTFNKGGVWSIRVAALQGLQSFIKKTCSYNIERWRSERDVQPIVEKIVQIIIYGIEDEKYHAVRSASLEALHTYLQRCIQVRSHFLTSITYRVLLWQHRYT